MGTLWVQVCTTLPDHPKTTALAEALNLSCAKLDGNAAATGLLIRLWTWAIQVKPDGCLSGCSPKALAVATRFRGKPEVLADALIQTGWIDQEDGDWYLHDWEQYAKLFLDKAEEKKEQNRLAQQACRARQKARKALENRADFAQPQPDAVAEPVLVPQVQAQPTPEAPASEPVLDDTPVPVTEPVIACQNDVSMTGAPCHTPTLPIQKPIPFSCAELATSSTPNVSPTSALVSQPESVPQPALQQPPVAQLLLNDGSTYPVYPSDVEKWAKRYPAVDVGQAMRNMEGWLEANAKNRKTKKGILRFINGWLARAQDSARRVPGQADAVEQPKKPELSLIWTTNENGEEVPVCVRQ